MKYTNIGQVIIMSVGFTTLFTAFATCQNFASKVLSDDGFDNIGFTTLAVLYLVFSLCSFLSTAIVNKIGNIAVSMSLGGLCYSFWIVCFLLPSFYSQADDRDNLPWILNKTLIQWLLIITAGINGAGAGVLWTSQGKFISECATDENKGIFNSIFWAFFMSANIIGNLTAALVLKSGSKQSNLFMLFAILAVFGSLLFCFLRLPNKKTGNALE